MLLPLVVVAALAVPAGSPARTAFLGLGPTDDGPLGVVVEAALAELHLKSSEEKTRTVTFDSCFRFLGAEMQQENIYLPFEKKREPLRPVYVAPVMPPGLLRAFRAGHLKAIKPLVWTGEREQAQRPKPSGKSRVTKACEALSGGAGSASLRLLSGRK